MKHATIFLALFCLFASCNMNEESKLVPQWGQEQNKFRAYIWKTDSIDPKAEPLEVMITIDKDSITRIESWDGQQKIDKDAFKPAKVRWNDPFGKGTFTILGRSYTFQVQGN